MKPRARCFTKNAYIKNGWNVLDFVIVVSSIVALFMSSGVSVLRVLRALRAFRNEKQQPPQTKNTSATTERLLGDSGVLSA